MSDDSVAALFQAHVAKLTVAQLALCRGDSRRVLGAADRRGFAFLPRGARRGLQARAYCVPGWFLFLFGHAPCSLREITAPPGEKHPKRCPHHHRPHNHAQRRPRARVLRGLGLGRPRPALQQRSGHQPDRRQWRQLRHAHPRTRPSFVFQRTASRRCWPFLSSAHASTATATASCHFLSAGGCQAADDSIRCAYDSSFCTSEETFIDADAVIDAGDDLRRNKFQAPHAMLST